ncbi:MAG: hypothetical protein P8H54_05770 [Flavobacteriaceae bacterium]|nr:hypothetical protein [Flavobacteriaceae bacterium]
MAKNISPSHKTNTLPRYQTQQHSDKTTEIYTRIATNSFKTIKNHLD